MTRKINKIVARTGLSQDKITATLKREDRFLGSSKVLGADQARILLESSKADKEAAEEWEFEQLSLGVSTDVNREQIRMLRVLDMDEFSHRCSEILHFLRGDPLPDLDAEVELFVDSLTEIQLTASRVVGDYSDPIRLSAKSYLP